MDEEKYLTVTALNRYIKYKFQYDNNLRNILISGEISNFKRHSRGHFYFTLKDSQSQISAIMFKSSADKVLFSPKDGDKVYLKASVDSYEQGGTYQLYVTDMKLSGIGDLYLKFEKLKKELSEAGLFDEKFKKPIPKYPNVIGVVTSPTGAAIHDIITTTSRRYPLARLILYPALVQGEGAKDSIASQIRKANMDSLCDVLIVGRGGGSLEDLWAFNEKIVAMAIFDSKIPVISAVGHEVDFSISDFVADKRAATPTAAAELATPNVLDIKQDLLEYNHQFNKNINYIIKDKKISLVNLMERLDKASPLQKLNDNKDKLNKLNERLNNSLLSLLIETKTKLDGLDKRLTPLFNNIIDYKKHSLDILDQKINPLIKQIMISKDNRFKLAISKLESLNPLSIMDKGYSIASKDQKVIRSINDVNKDDNIRVRLKDGSINAKVVEVNSCGK